jgi:inner membrane protein
MAATDTLKLPFPRRSLGLKLLLVCALALLMSIPALMVFGLLMDRSSRAEAVAGEVGGLMGGPQTFLGPVIAVPYSLTRAAEAGQPATTTQSVWIVYPETGEMTISSESEVRKRSLFRVPVYEAALSYVAQFDLADAGEEAPAGAVLDWSRAELIVGASGVRGARSDLTLAVGGAEAVALEPASLLSTLTLNEDLETNPHMQGSSYGPPSLGLFSTALGEVDRAAGPFEVRGEALFSGAQRMAILAFARTTTARMTGDWPHPSYGGGFLPSEQGPAANGPGFAAAWTVPYVARGVPSEGGTETLARLGGTNLAVSFVEPANPYQSVSRSLKYAPMFIGLVFLAYFLFETTTGKRVHPAQYILVGLAQVIFYMLLLSIAEHTGFDIAFGIAATATVALISAYAGWTFKSRAQGIRALVAFAFLYGLIYVLMRLEDYALLVGALASFAAIAAVMWFTRNIDWYGGKGDGDAPASA